jgi:hypothetical protein
MFFPSPSDGIREMLRVLKPAKKAAFAVWHFAENNPFHYVLSRIVDEFVESPPLPPDAPDAFRFAEPGKLQRLLIQSGASESASERLLRFSIRIPVSLEDFWTLRCEMSEKLREQLASLSEDQLRDLKRRAVDAFSVYSTASGIQFPAEVLIVTARK